MAYGPEGIVPDYAYKQMLAGRNQPSNFETFGRHALGATLGALGGGLGAYGVHQGILAQQPQDPSQLIANRMQSGEMAKAQLPTFASQAQSQQPTPNVQDQLSQMLSNLTSKKIDQMMDRRQGVPQPQSLRQMAFDASNQQASQQGPPTWAQQRPGFAFEQYVGQGQEYNPLSALADLGVGAVQETDTTQPWWRQAVHGFGKIASGAAPIAGMLGPWGLAAGAGLGALGYLSQQV